MIVAKISEVGGRRLYRFDTPEEPVGTVVLAHGMFSDSRAVRVLAETLSAKNYDVWSFDFRGHGQSVRAEYGESFESVCLADVSAVLSEVRRQSDSGTITWIGHSGGGLAALMFLAREPGRQSEINRVITLASQATGAANGPYNWLKIAGILAATTVLPNIPGGRFGVGIGDETSHVMAQWCKWNLTRCWIGDDKFDYLEALQSISCQVLMFAGDADNFIAPMSGCKTVYEALGSEDRRFVQCGTQMGFKRDYGHAGIISSRAAVAEIFPLMLSWMEETSHCSPTTGAKGFV